MLTSEHAMWMLYGASAATVTFALTLVLKLASTEVFMATFAAGGGLFFAAAFIDQSLALMLFGGLVGLGYVVLLVMTALGVRRSGRGWRDGGRRWP
jgi:hypothetical protein